MSVNDKDIKDKLLKQFVLGRVRYSTGLTMKVAVPVFKPFIIIDHEIFNMAFEGYENGGTVGSKLD